MELGDKEKRKLMAAAELVEKGDIAVLTKILEFEDILEDFKEEIDEKLAEKDTEIEEHKKNIYSEMSSKMGEMLAEISIIKQDVEKMVKNDHMEAMHAKMMAEYDTKLQRFKSDLEVIRASIPEMPESFDPTDVLNRISEVESKIPTIPEIPKELTAFQVRDKLESIEDEKEKLKIEAIQDLAKRLDDLEKRPISRGGGTSAIGVRQAFKYIAHTEQPTGDIDGVNTTYTVKNEIFWVAGFTLNGEQIAQLPNFTYKGRTITFSSALPAAYSGKDFEIKYIG